MVRPCDALKEQADPQVQNIQIGEGSNELSACPDFALNETSKK